MPKRLKLQPYAAEELERRYRKARDPVERTHHQIVWLLSEGRTTKQVCEATGYSPGWVRRRAHHYNEREDALVERCLLLSGQPELLRGSTSYHWWPEAA